MTYYLVGSIQHTVQVDSGSDSDISYLKLTWADGMIGAIPVFDTKENADKYADGKVPVIEIKENKPEIEATDED